MHLPAKVFRWLARICTKLDVNRCQLRYTPHVLAMYRPIVFPKRSGNFSPSGLHPWNYHPLVHLTWKVTSLLANLYLTKSPVFSLEHPTVPIPRSNFHLRWITGNFGQKFNPARVDLFTSVIMSNDAVSLSYPVQRYFLEQK